MNLYYLMSNEYDGLNKFASEYINDAANLTGLFYGMLKEAARTNRNGKSKAGRTVNTHMSFDTSEAREAASASSAADKAKATAKRQRNIENSFHFPKNDTSPAHLKEQARIKQTFRLGDPEYAERVRARGSRIGNALIDKYKTSASNYKNALAGAIANRDNLNSRLSDLTRRYTDDTSSLYSRLNAQADELKGVRDALSSARTQRNLDKAALISNKYSIDRLKNLANNRSGQIKNLTKSLKRTKLGMIGAGVGGLGLGAGAMALYNNRQAQ